MSIFDYEEELRTSHLPCVYFTQTSISLVVESPRLFIFSTSKSTPVKLLPVVCNPNPAADPHIIVQVVCEHFNYQWESRLSNLDQSSQAWSIKPTVPCGLDPFQLQIIISINGERKTILDRYANIVCKASEFPKGLAHLLIQERNGRQVTPDVFNKLKKKKILPGIRLDLPNDWEAMEQWRVIDNIWYTLDAKNANRPLCKPNGPFPILKPSRQFIDSIQYNPLGQYRLVWIWIYGVLRFYSMYYNSMKNHIGRIPECIDRRSAEERLYNAPTPSVIVRFGSDGEDIVCSTWEDGNIEHYQFSWKSKPGPKSTPLSQLPKHLSQLSKRNFQYLPPQESFIHLNEVISLFSLSLNQPMSASTQGVTVQQKDPKILSQHCRLLNQYIFESRQRGSSISLDQLEFSLQSLMKHYDVSIPQPKSPPEPQTIHHYSHNNVPFSPPNQYTPQPHHNHMVMNTPAHTPTPPPPQQSFVNPFSEPNPFFNDTILHMHDDMHSMSGDQFLELVNSAGPGDMLFSLYPQSGVTKRRPSKPNQSPGGFM